MDLEHGPLASSCHKLSDVCVDQGSAILYGQQYQMRDGKPGAPLPVLDPPKRHRHYIFFHRDTGERDYRYGLPPLHVRPASADEPTPYLAEPVFSSCTVPVVYYSHYIQNPAHMFRDNAARLFGALTETSWVAHAKLVLMTAEGLAPPPFAYDLLRPLADTSVETWADFSSRLPSQQVEGGYLPGPIHDPAAASEPDSLTPESYEGGPQRCFRHMFVCMDNINITGWPLHAYGQHLVRYYEQHGLLPPGALPAERPREAAQRRLATAAAGAEGGTEHVISIAFQKRSSPERQLVNRQELLERCNAWRYTPPKTAVTVRADCWEVETNDVLSGVVAAQQADVFVGAHGANIANAWLMRPGSSVVELTMHEFDEFDGHMNLVKRNMFDNETQVQFWKVLLCDAKSWTPGTLEAEALAKGGPSQPIWTKYRNLIVRWEALEAAFRDIVELGGEMAAYRQRYKEGRFWWLSTANETVYAGRDIYTSCKKAREAGLIS